MSKAYPGFKSRISKITEVGAIFQDTTQVLTVVENLTHRVFVHSRNSEKTFLQTFSCLKRKKVVSWLTGSLTLEGKGAQPLPPPPWSKKIILREIAVDKKEGVDKKATKMTQEGRRAAKIVMSLTQFSYVLSSVLNLSCLVSHKIMIILQRAATKTHPRSYQCIGKYIFAQKYNNSTTSPGSTTGSRKKVNIQRPLLVFQLNKVQAHYTHRSKISLQEFSKQIKLFALRLM